MITAKVRISTVMTNDSTAVGELKKIEGVKNAYLNFGMKEIFVEIQGNDKKTLDNILFLRIRRLKGIRSTSPLILD